MIAVSQLAKTGQAAPRISICMPVYNVAPYLERCLKSVLGQTFQDFVLIAVNDGSTDDSLQILQKFARLSPKIQIVNQENQGMSAARNHALSLSESEYVCFLDSDDFLHPDYLLRLYQTARRYQADIACCYFTYHFQKSGFRFPHPFRKQGVFDSVSAMRLLFHDLHLQSYAWNKLYKRRLFSEHHISFPSIAFEDIATAHQLFFFSNRVAITKECLYYYVQRDSSTLGNMKIRTINDFIRATASVRVSLSQLGVYPLFYRDYAALCRKTNFFCKLYRLKVAQKNHSYARLFTDLRTCSHALRLYANPSFDLSPYFPAPGELPAIPDTLPELDVPNQKRSFLP